MSCTEISAHIESMYSSPHIKVPVPFLRHQKNVNRTEAYYSPSVVTVKDTKGKVCSQTVCTVV